MKSRTTAARFAILVILILALSANAQYDLVFPGTPPPVAVDTLVPDTMGVDSTVADSMEAMSPSPVPQVETPPPPLDEKTLSNSAVKEATTWLRRLVLRGWFDDNVTGTWAEYQLTDWRAGSGSFGPVRGRLTVYYLGGTSWMGRTAAKLQAMYRALDDNSTVVEFDLVVSASEKISEIHRALYRVNRGSLANAAFGMAEGQLDYDKLDRPQDTGFQELKLYSGTYSTTLYKGSGTDAAVVYAYRSSKLPPLGLVILGYGEEAMTLTSFGDGALPRFEAPAPSVR